jgi:hypothetical protein
MSQKTRYSYSKKIEFMYDNTQTEFFKISSLLIDNKNNIKKMDGVYFPIRYNANYSIMLWDYIGAYLKLRRVYEKLIPIFFYFDNLRIDTTPWPPMVKDFISFFNAEVIDIDKESFLFEKVILVKGCQPPIPREVYISNDWIHEELNDEVKQWWISTTKEVVDFFKPTQNINKNNNYITRSKINKTYSGLKNSWEESRLHSFLYDEYLDEKIKENGFNVIETTGMGFFDQINIGHGSKVYSTIDGSGLVNAFWTEKNTPIICFKVNEKYTKYNFYWEEMFESLDKKIQVVSLEKMSENLGCKRIVKTLQKFI